MKFIPIISLLLAFSLLVGCTAPAVAEISSSEEVSVVVAKSSKPEASKPPSKEPESESVPSPESEPEESEKPMPEIEADSSANNTRPIKEVAALSDDYALDKLPAPIEEYEALDNNSVVWGPGYTSDEVPPSEPSRLQKSFGGYDAYFLVPDSNKIYFSFDEGYEAGYTAAILDTLKEKSVTAVFFVTLGYVRDSPDLVARMVNEGHVIGNHSCSHPVGGMPTMAPLDIAKDILYLHQFMIENYSYEMTLFRPPEGTFSVRSLKVLQDLGYKSIFWSFAHRDWEVANQPDLNKTLDTIVSRSHPGAIYLLHAVSSSNTTVLGEAINRLREKGYEFSDWSDIA